MYKRSRLNQFLLIQSAHDDDGFVIWSMQNNIKQQICTKLPTSLTQAGDTAGPDVQII